MSERELMDTTPKAFSLKVEGWAEQQRHAERNEWERARWAATMAMNPHLKRPLKPTDLFKFDDEQKKVTRIDPEIDKEANRIAAKYKPPTKDGRQV